MTAQTFKRLKGFTLVELLVVIAILGILAGAILVAINPTEQLARGRDAGRKTSVSQLGSAVQAYYTSQNVTYPTQDATWMTALQTSGEIKVLPTNPAGGSGYATGCYTTPSPAESGFCYKTDGTNAVVYAEAESSSSYTAAGCSGTEIDWIVWSSELGKTGLACTAADTDPALTGLTLN